MVPVWYTAGYKIKRVLKARQAPLVAIGAAFSFIIMMFNIPVPGGTTGHAVGGTLLAVALGPWAAVISLTVALAIQALFFGDGGVLALGANCFNIAFALPVSGYLIYRFISLGASANSSRRWLGAGIGAYVGINISALLTALEIGMQGDLFLSANGTPLYSPYGLSQTIPAMMISHLAVIGLIEASVTALVVLYLQRTNPGILFNVVGPRQVEERGLKLKPLIIGLVLMLVFVPLGLLATGTAWGEWSPDEIKNELGFVPEGLERFSRVWNGVLPDYLSGDGFWSSVPGYFLSAAVGLMTISALTYLAVRLLSRGKGDN